jgi:hypothetical protein
MRLKQYLAGAVAAAALLVAGASDAATVIIHKKHRTIIEHRAPVVRVVGRHIGRDRVVEVVRARHIRFIGAPYMHRGYYVLRCYDRFGRLAYCKVHPKTGAFIGISARL